MFAAKSRTARPMRFMAAASVRRDERIVPVCDQRATRGARDDLGHAVPSARKPARKPLGHPAGGSRARWGSRPRRLVRRRAHRGADSLAVLAVDRKHGPVLHHRRDGCAHGLRRHRDRSRRADGDRDILGPHPAALVPRPHAEGDAGGSRWHAHVLVRGAPADRRRLRPGSRRDIVRTLGLPVPAGLHRLLRSIHPPAETGGGRCRCCEHRSLDVRADCALRRSAGHPMGARDDPCGPNRGCPSQPAAARSRLSIPTVSSSGHARVAPSSSCRIR